MIISQVLLLGCKDEDSKEYIEGQIPETEVAAYIAQMNQDIADMQQLVPFAGISLRNYSLIPVLLF